MLSLCAGGWLCWVRINSSCNMLRVRNGKIAFPSSNSPLISLMRIVMPWWWLFHSHFVPKWPHTFSLPTSISSSLSPIILSPSVHVEGRGRGWEAAYETNIFLTALDLSTTINECRNEDEGWGGGGGDEKAEEDTDHIPQSISHFTCLFSKLWSEMSSSFHPDAGDWWERVWNTRCYTQHWRKHKIELEHIVSYAILWLWNQKGDEMSKVAIWWKCQNIMRWRKEGRRVVWGLTFPVLPFHYHYSLLRLQGCMHGIVWMDVCGGTYVRRLEEEMREIWKWCRSSVNVAQLSIPLNVIILRCDALLKKDSMIPLLPTRDLLYDYIRPSTKQHSFQQHQQHSHRVNKFLHPSQTSISSNPIYDGGEICMVQYWCVILYSRNFCDRTRRSKNTTQ